MGKLNTSQALKELLAHEGNHHAKLLIRGCAQMFLRSIITEHFAHNCRDLKNFLHSVTSSVGTQ